MKIGKTKRAAAEERPAKTGKTTKLKKAEKSPLELAQGKVKEFEEIKLEIHNRAADFDEEFPQAAQVLRGIDELRAKAHSIATEAHALVAAAKVSVGDFKCSLPITSPGFDGAKLAEVLASVRDADGDPDYAAMGELFFELYNRGVIKSVAVNQESGKLVRQQNEAVRDLTEEAWSEGGQELTPRVKIPSI